MGWKAKHCHKAKGIWNPSYFLICLQYTFCSSKCIDVIFCSLSSSKTEVKSNTEIIRHQNKKKKKIEYTNIKKWQVLKDSIHASNNSLTCIKWQVQKCPNEYFGGAILKESNLTTVQQISKTCFSRCSRQVHIQVSQSYFQQPQAAFMLFEHRFESLKLQGLDIIVLKLLTRT